MLADLFGRAARLWFFLKTCLLTASVLRFTSAAIFFTLQLSACKDFINADSRASTW